MVGVQEAQDLTESFLPIVVGKHFCIDTRGVTVAKVCGKLHFRMLRIIVFNKASNKSDNDRLADYLILLLAVWAALSYVVFQG